MVRLFEIFRVFLRVSFRCTIASIPVLLIFSAFYFQSNQGRDFIYNALSRELSLYNVKISKEGFSYVIPLRFTSKKVYIENGDLLLSDVSVSANPVGLLKFCFSRDFSIKNFINLGIVESVQINKAITRYGELSKVELYDFCDRVNCSAVLESNNFLDVAKVDIKSWYEKSSANLCGNVILENIGYKDFFVRKPKIEFVCNTRKAVCSLSVTCSDIKYGNLLVSEAGSFSSEFDYAKRSVKNIRLKTTDAEVEGEVYCLSSGSLLTFAKTNLNSGIIKVDKIRELLDDKSVFYLSGVIDKKFDFYGALSLLNPSVTLCVRKKLNTILSESSVVETPYCDLKSTCSYDIRGKTALITSEINKLRYGDFDISDGNAKVQCKLKDGKFVASLNCGFSHKKNCWNLLAKTHGVISEKWLFNIDHINLSGNAANFYSDGLISVKQSGVDGKLLLKIKDLSLLGYENVKGNGDAEVFLKSGNLIKQEQVKFKSKFHNLRTKWFGASSTMISGDYCDGNLLLTAFSKSGYIGIQKFDFIEIKSVPQLSNQNNSISINSRIDNGRSFFLNANSYIDKTVLNIVFNNASLRKRGLEVSINQGAKLSWDFGKNIFSATAVLKMGDKGKLSLDYLFNNNLVSGSLSMDRVPLGGYEIFDPYTILSTSVSGNVKIGGTYSDPSADADLFFDNFYWKAKTKATLRNNMVNVVSELKDKAFYIKSELLFPFVFNGFSDKQIKGTIVGKANLSHIAMPDGIDLKGIINADIKLDGTLKSPSIFGSAKLTDGYLEVGASGTLLQNAVIDLVANGKRIVLNKLYLNDASDGKAVGSGSIEIRDGAPIAQFYSNINIILDKLHIFDDDDLEVTATGNTRLEGPLPEWVLRGKVTLPKIDYMINQSAGADVEDVKIVETGRARPLKSQLKKAGFIPCKCETDLVCPYVKVYDGRTTNTEWKGNMKLVGGLNDPIGLSGVLNLTKGYLDFSGRRIPFIMGKIKYFPDSLLPVVSLHGQKFIGDLDVRLDINVSNAMTRFELTSIPDLPKDAILARILFNKPIQNLSAPEMIQLLHAVSNLEGHGPLAVLDEIKGLTGMDTLTFSEPIVNNKNRPTSQTTKVVTFGKYISEDIYMTIDNDVEEQTTTLGVQTNVSKGTSVDLKSNGIFGVSWRYRY